MCKFNYNKAFRMKKIALLSATAILLVSCSLTSMQTDEFSKSPELTISNSSGSFVGKKVNEFTAEYNNIRTQVNKNAEELLKLQQDIYTSDEAYREIISSIEDRLEVGTTPSNPDLVASLAKAQENLGVLDSSIHRLSQISSNTIAEKEKLLALASTVNATYGIPGAYDEDHADLNEILGVISQQEIVTADIIAEVKSDIISQQAKADEFRAEITRLNVDVAAGYFRDSDLSFTKPNLQVTEIKPTVVTQTPAKEKSLRTNTKKVKLMNKVGVITDDETKVNAKAVTEKKVDVKKQQKTSVAKKTVAPKKVTSKKAPAKVTKKAPVVKPVAKKTVAPKVETPKAETPKVEEVEAVETPKVETPKVEEVKAVETPKVETPKVEEVKAVETPKVETPKVEEVEAVETPKAETPKFVTKLPEGTIFSKDFPNNDVSYYSELTVAVQNTMSANPDTKLEVIALMPMSVKEQDRMQNLMAKVFGELLDMHIPAENLHISSISEIGRDVPTLVVRKRK